MVNVIVEKITLEIASQWAQLIAVIGWVISLILESIRRSRSRRLKVESLLIALTKECENNMSLLKYVEAKTLNVSHDEYSISLTVRAVSLEVLKLITSDADCIPWLKKENILDDLWKIMTTLRFIKADPSFRDIKNVATDFVGHKYTCMQKNIDLIETIKSKIVKSLDKSIL